jgi:hypothetical protein
VRSAKPMLVANADDMAATSPAHPCMRSFASL